MAIVDTTTSETMTTGNESIVIVLCLEVIPGGRTLDTTGYSGVDVIEAGHVIIEETATKELKPLNISAGAYVALPAGHTYKGILVAPVLIAKPFASILVRGTINQAVAPYTIPAGAKTALPLIRFTQD